MKKLKKISKFNNSGQESEGFGLNFEAKVREK